MEILIHFNTSYFSRVSRDIFCDLNDLGVFVGW
jgi:hypothetical protein